MTLVCTFLLSDFNEFSEPCFIIGALEPVISAEIMQIHYTKHHNAYVTNLNLAMTKLEELTHKGDVSGVIAQQAAIKFNGIDIFKYIHACILNDCYIL